MNTFYNDKRYNLYQGKSFGSNSQCIGRKIEKNIPLTINSPKIRNSSLQVGPQNSANRPYVSIVSKLEVKARSLKIEINRHHNKTSFKLLLAIQDTWEQPNILKTKKILEEILKKIEESDISGIPWKITKSEVSSIPFRDQINSLIQLSEEATKEKQILFDSSQLGGIVSNNKDVLDWHIVAVGDQQSIDTQQKLTMQDMTAEIENNWQKNTKGTYKVLLWIYDPSLTGIIPVIVPSKWTIENYSEEYEKYICAREVTPEDMKLTLMNYLQKKQANPDFQKNIIKEYTNIGKNPIIYNKGCFPPTTIDPSTEKPLVKLQLYKGPKGLFLGPFNTEDTNKNNANAIRNIDQHPATDKYNAMQLVSHFEEKVLKEISEKGIQKVKEWIKAIKKAAKNTTPEKPIRILVWGFYIAGFGDLKNCEKGQTILEKALAKEIANKKVVIEGYASGWAGTISKENIRDLKPNINIFQHFNFWARWDPNYTYDLFQEKVLKDKKFDFEFQYNVGTDDTRNSVTNNDKNKVLRIGEMGGMAGVSNCLTALISGGDRVGGIGYGFHLDEATKLKNTKVANDYLDNISVLLGDTNEIANSQYLLLMSRPNSELIYTVGQVKSQLLGSPIIDQETGKSTNKGIYNLIRIAYSWAKKDEEKNTDIFLMSTTLADLIKVGENSTAGFKINVLELERAIDTIISVAVINIEKTSSKEKTRDLRIIGLSSIPNDLLKGMLSCSSIAVVHGESSLMESTESGTKGWMMPFYSFQLRTILDDHGVEKKDSSLCYWHGKSVYLTCDSKTVRQASILYLERPNLSSPGEIEKATYFKDENNQWRSTFSPIDTITVAYLLPRSQKKSPNSYNTANTAKVITLNDLGKAYMALIYGTKEIDTTSLSELNRKILNAKSWKKHLQ